MGLREYRKKRDFSATPEPPPDRIARSRNGKSSGRGSKILRFVVQEHHARRLHYDFRLEHGGALWSWAVPKEPSLDPKVRRLAIRTEDHPLDYATFQGVIPKGHYGAGRVIRWDAGTWQPDSDPAAGIRAGKLHFRLAGKRLRGHFHLTRLRGREQDAGKENWLLIGHGDAKAAPRDASSARVSGKRDRATASSKSSPRRTAASRFAASDFQLATLVESVPTGAEWIHETKFDGYRVALEIRDGTCRVITRGGQDWTSKFRSVAEAAESLGVSDAILDGEIVVLDGDGRSSFQLLQQFLGRSGGRWGNRSANRSANRSGNASLDSSEQATAPKRVSGPLIWYGFDVLELEGEDLRALPLIDRKRALKRLLGRKRGALRYADHVEGQGADLWKEACRIGLEGVVSKRKAGRHQAGRGLDWCKTKCSERQEFVIGGFTEPRGSRKGIGALLLGVYRDGKLRFAGKVGTGFGHAGLVALRRKLNALERTTPAYIDPPSDRSVHWIEPKLVGEVSFTGWTADGRLRHPSFQALREDKDPRTIVRERARPIRREPAAPPAGRKVKVLRPSVSRPRVTRGRAARAPVTRPSHASRQVKVRRLSREKSSAVSAVDTTVTHPDRVLFPGSKVTKGDLARYLATVAPRMLPHIAGRPLSLVRCPNGVARGCFFQRHLEGAKKVVVHTAQDLVDLAQIGVIEIHPSGAREDDYEAPDVLVLDLDPGPGVKWSDTIAAAHRIRALLAKLGLESFPKVTGGKGLHVVTRIDPPLDWATHKEFAKRVAEKIAKADPDHFTTNVRKDQRKGRIFIDYLRNGEGATAIAPWSPRAREGAPVAMPVSWREVTPKLKPDAFSFREALLRAAKSDPWPGFFDSRPRKPGSPRAGIAATPRSRPAVTGATGTKTARVRKARKAKATSGARTRRTAKR